MRLKPSFGLFGFISLLVLSRICCESDISRRRKIDFLLRIKDKETIPTEIKDVQNVWVQKKKVIRKQNLQVQLATKKPPNSKESGGSRTILIIVAVAVCVLCIGNIIFCIVMYDRGKKSKKLGKGSISKTSSRRSLDKIEQNVSRNRSTYSKLYSKSRDQLRTEAEIISLMKKATDPAVNKWVNGYLSKSRRSDVLFLTAQRKSTPRSAASIRTVRRSSRSLSKTSQLTKYPDLPLSKFPSLSSKKYNASLTKTHTPSASSTEIESNTSVVSESALSEYTTESESSPTSRSLGRKSVKRGNMHESPTAKTPTKQGKPKPKKSRNGKDTSSSAPPPHPVPTITNSHSQLQDYLSSVPPPIPPFHAKNVQPQDYPSSIPPPPPVPSSIPPPPPVPSSIPPPPPVPSSIPPPPPIPSSIPPPPPATSKNPMDFLQSIKAGVKLKPVTEPETETLTGGRSDFLKSIQAGVKLKPVVVSESTSKGAFDICQSIKAGHTLKPVADRSLKSKPMDHETLLSQAVLKPNLTSVKERKFQQPHVQEETFTDILKSVKLRRASVIKRRTEEVSEDSRTQIPIGSKPQPPDLQLELKETLINKYPTTVTKHFDKDYEWKNKVRHKKKEKTQTYPPGDEVSIEEVRQRPKISQQIVESVAKKIKKKSHVKASRKNKNKSKK